MAAALERERRKHEPHADPLARAGQATPFCTQCGREWEGLYFSLKALMWSFLVGAGVGLIACAELVRSAPRLW